ncbi:MAG: SH3 domain-containing protein [Anaerolineae bacterium]|nr:SH3 domain-containing protein [Anaerolineae bacterium]
MRLWAHRWRVGLLLIITSITWLAAAPITGARGPFVRQTPAPDVFAEAIGQANLRGGPGIDYPMVGEIVAGTRYRVLARHALVPWLKLELLNTPEAWVYTELVSVTGDLGLVPIVNEFGADSPTPTLDAASALPDSTPTIPPPTPTITGPVATTLGEVNVRFGPGLEYPTITAVPEGASFRVLELHALVPWVRIELPDAPDGTGWIFTDTITITGDTSTLPVTNAIQFTVPELTPTPQTVVVNGAPWDGAPIAQGTLASTLGEELHAYLLERGFAPYSNKMASVFVMDLQTGDTFTINDGVAYSGMSLTKIPILVTYFQRHDGPLTFDEAYLIGDTMMCSENITTNQLLELIGEGNPLQGAQRVTALMQSFDLRSTFIMRHYVTSDDEEPIQAGTIQSGVDQTSAQPDLYNQVLPADIGWLLAGIYQCAQDETGLLMERYPNNFNAQECRQMLYAMDANVINVFIEAGVPRGTRVVHKHGWIEDTHGDAGIVFGPNGAYVIVMVMYARDHLDFVQYSSPILAEISRMTWNTLNPAAAVDDVTIGIVPDQCDPRNDPVIDALLSTNLPMMEP